MAAFERWARVRDVYEQMANLSPQYAESDKKRSSHEARKIRTRSNNSTEVRKGFPQALSCITLTPGVRQVTGVWFGSKGHRCCRHS
jgi:hypothetical protein